MDYQTIIETFFCMLGRFDFDRAKTYIDGRREVLHRLAPTFPNQAQFMTMLTTFSHLAEVEKNYHNQPYSTQPTHHHHSFLPTTSFLRKPKSLRDMYNDILFELQQIEEMETASTSPNSAGGLGGKVVKSASTSSASTHRVTLPALPKLRTRHSVESPGAEDQRSQNSSSTEKDSPVAQVPQSPGSAIKNSFFRVLSPISTSASNSSSQQFNHLTSSSSATFSASGGVEPYSLSSSSGYEPPPNSTTSTPVAQVGLNLKEFSEELISHFCCQLLNFTQARLDLIDVYEKLTKASQKKFTSVDGVAFKLSMLCRQYQKYFHHPLLAPIKEGVTLECESLMTLIKATIDMQHWRFLPTLYGLQDAQSKLSYWANNTFNKEATRRRFKVSKALTAPRLYEWLCRFKDFLVAKFTLYFHATLSRNFPSGSFKGVCSKLTVDYYSKLSGFQRRVDALFVALLYDVSNERDFRGNGYYFPSKGFQLPQGKNTLQPMVIIPGEAKARLNNLSAEIYMIVMTNQTSMIKDGHYQFHDNIKKLTYSISKPDSNVVLVTVCEGQKLDREMTVRSFSQDFMNQFAFASIFTS